MAGTVGRVENLVVEDAEVEGQTETDGVGRGELSLCNVGRILCDASVAGWGCVDGRRLSYLVGLVSSGGRHLALLPGGELGQVSVVITLPVVLLDDRRDLE